MIWCTDHVILHIHLPSVRVSLFRGRQLVVGGILSSIWSSASPLSNVFFKFLPQRHVCVVNFECSKSQSPKFHIIVGLVFLVHKTKSSGYKGSAPKLLIRSSRGACKSSIISTSHRKIYLPCGCAIVLQFPQCVFIMSQPLTDWDIWFTDWSSVHPTWVSR